MRKIICTVIYVFVSLIVFSQVNLTNGLVAYYPFSGNSNDLSGNGHHAMNMGNISLTTDRFGNANSAYYFDGIDDYLKISDDNSAFSTPQFSLVLWFQTETDALQNLVGKRSFTNASGSGGSQYQFFINYPPFPGIGSNIVGNNSTCFNTNSSSYLNTNNWICRDKWYCAVIVFDGFSHSIYIDGKLKTKSVTSFSSFLSCNSELRFGNWWQQDLLSFKGKMDDIRWYNRALNKDEIEALYGNFEASTRSIDFSFDQSTCNNKEVKLIANNANLASSNWSFGDGTFGAGSTVAHTYFDYGDYFIKFKSENALGCFDSIEKKLSIVKPVKSILLNLKDTTICKGQSVLMTSNISSLDNCWKSTNGVSFPNSTMQLVTPSNSETYFLTAQITGTNLIPNGNFSLGKSDFTSDYAFASLNSNEGQYWVGNDVPKWNISYGNCKDHTSGSGNMLMVNGSSLLKAKVWSTTINVLPNTSYNFSFWLQSLRSVNPAKLRFSINNVLMEKNVNGENTSCNWSFWQTSWNSGNLSKAELSIINDNSLNDGNDFAIDDISFSKIDFQYDSVHVNVVEPPNLSARTDTSICANSTIMLPANGAQHYSWTPALEVSDPKGQSPVVSPNKSSQYIVTGWDMPGCYKKDTVNVDVFPKAVFSITPDRFDVCDGDQVTMTASGADQYSWFTDEENNISSSTSLTLTARITDTIFVRLDSRCSTDTLRSIVKVNPKPIIAIKKSNDIDCVSLEAQLTASGGTLFNWSPNVNIDNPNIPNPIVHPESDTWYKVFVANGGCTVSDSIQVHANLLYGTNGFHIPNAFTPNNDGKNDCFNLRHWGETTYFELWIYNRWGELVFHSTEKNSCWDGTYKNVKQPSGVYIYQVKAESPCSYEPIYKKGVITLIR